MKAGKLIMNDKIFSPTGVALVRGIILEITFQKKETEI